ncbi:endoglucanase EG-1 [Emericellopsis atlantica]|uniref:Glucanase n=1 Tax=Emericellopsis atlantica TaxID=2614577 RepID=A0A9P7ZM93_9HYPO|nr:endoglucanase EG-1 [Emericellopsis atlantica]KAG9254271.1 endoglucanase EG-1 [Emericellopsis atlantica]
MALFLASALVGLAAAQSPGDKPDVHPGLTTWECTKAGGCLQKNTYVVLDSLAHPVYQVDAPEYNCGDWGNPPNATACPDAETCQQNCIMQGVQDYTKVGVFTEGASMRMELLGDNGAELSPRVYLLSEDKETYEMLSLTGKEFTFDVDVSKLPCGMNGALYLSEMPADGGLSELNQAGAYWGTGYCDAQCYTTPFVGGEPNIEGYGACCNEMDIFEANSRAVHVAPHPCNITGLVECEGAECEADGICDKSGCAYNAWRFDNEEHYGLGLEVDTTRPFTVISQYPADENGVLTGFHRMYIQDGRLIDNGEVVRPSLPQIDYLNDELCEATYAEDFLRLGATAGMGEAMARGMVLAMSIWWDRGGNMQWLDGGEAGPCNATEGNPDEIVKVEPRPEVTYSNIKWGEIGSTFKDPSKCKSRRS